MALKPGSKYHDVPQKMHVGKGTCVLFAIKKNEQLGFVGVACGIWGRSSQYALLLLDGIASRKCMIGKNKYINFFHIKLAESYTLH